jgi:hypothetical protein
MAMQQEPFPISEEVSDMNPSRIVRSFGHVLLCAIGWFALGANAEVFYGGDTKGFPGDPVFLTVNARAGTVLEGIDIVLPDPPSVAGVLNFVSFVETTGLTDEASSLACSSSGCSVVYDIVNGKTFSTDTLLVTMNFIIDPAAPVGPVFPEFAPSVVVGVNDALPIPQDQRFEVLAIPEPSNWLLMLFGLGVVALAAPRCRRAQASFGARRAAVLRAARRLRAPPRGALSQ